MQVDFGKTAADYGRHRAGFPDGFFERLFQRSLIAPGSRVLDVGTGTGTVARGLAKRGCNVLGLDPSATLLQEAERLDGEAGQPNHKFDVVTAGQCWHWFDRPRAAIEARRVIVPGGHLVIGHFDWLPLPGNVVEATERLILSYNPDWRGAVGAVYILPGSPILRLLGSSRLKASALVSTFRTAMKPGLVEFAPAPALEPLSRLAPSPSLVRNTAISSFGNFRSNRLESRIACSWCSAAHSRSWLLCVKFGPHRAVGVQRPQALAHSVISSGNSGPQCTYVGKAGRDIWRTKGNPT